MKTIIALGIMLSINVFLFLGNQAIAEINGNSSSFYNYDNSMMKKYDVGNYTLNENIDGLFPSSSGAISPDTGNFFTDAFASIRNWILDNTPLGFAWDLINSVPNFLKHFIGGPFAYAIGFFWHVLTIFLIVSFIKGSD